MAVAHFLPRRFRGPPLSVGLDAPAGRLVSPYPAFGIRSIVVVLGRRLATETGKNLPVLESRPSGNVFAFLAIRHQFLILGPPLLVGRLDFLPFPFFFFLAALRLDAFFLDFRFMAMSAPPTPRAGSRCYHMVPSLQVRQRLRYFLPLLGFVSP